ncbi:MAG: NusG domain II-containing protein [Firmicutes bacterium]|nr:NusG domain II-containing protein [Bacillota bacterium]
MGFKKIEQVNSTGNLYAKITYQDELILMIDLESLDYIIYDTVYKDDINATLSSQGIFYVPGTTSTDMQDLYITDEFARDNEIKGIKILVENEKISVVYQESPKDICQLQKPTNSSLEPLVCLPNELFIQVFTNMASEEFILDAVVE